MLDAYKELIADQYEAALCTLNICIDRCPDNAWDAPVVNLQFCQVAFHTLFFTDYYLAPNEDAFREQQFHRDNEQFFRDYEELKDRKQEFLYGKPTTINYLQHCRGRASEVISAETEETLTGPSGFERRTFSRAELHVYNMRHIHHHAAQLSLRLRQDASVDIPWVGSGWQDVA